MRSWQEGVSRGAVATRRSSSWYVAGSPRIASYRLPPSTYSMTMNTDPSALAWITSLSETMFLCAPPLRWHLWSDATSRCCRHSPQDRNRRVMCLIATVPCRPHCYESGAIRKDCCDVVM